jgi:CheY-like chemotaxis protein
VLGDANRLQQIVWNLLSNAVKFSPIGGEVSVQLRRNGPSVEVVVLDNGGGINSEFLPFVFDRFRQADSSTTRRHGGLGLGLAIVRHLVELHGGSVNAESEGEGLGARFTVTFPQAAPALENKEEPPGEEAGEFEQSLSLFKKLKVLVIDDEADARELLVQMLTSCHAEVRTSGSATEAFAVLTCWQPDILISDISMPDTDGYTFIRTLRNGELNGDIPAISLTAHASEGDRRKALAAGFQEHLSKPVQMRALVRSIARLTGRIKETEN